MTTNVTVYAFTGTKTSATETSETKTAAGTPTISPPVSSSGYRDRCDPRCRYSGGKWASRIEPWAVRRDTWCRWCSRVWRTVTYEQQSRYLHASKIGTSVAAAKYNAGEPGLGLCLYIARVSKCGQPGVAHRYSSTPS